MFFSRFKKKILKNFLGDLKTKSQNLQKKKFFYKKRSTKIQGFQKYCCPRAKDGNFQELEALRPRTSKYVPKDSNSVNGM